MIDFLDCLQANLGDHDQPDLELGWRDGHGGITALEAKMDSGSSGSEAK